MTTLTETIIYQAADAATDEQLDDEFPADIRWSVYSNTTRRAVAANRTAALYAALLIVRDRSNSVRELTLIGPRVIDGQNVGIRYPLYASALVSQSAAIQSDYGLMRLQAAVDDLRAIAKDVDSAARQATDAVHAINVLRNFDGSNDTSQALTGWLATETAALFEDRTFACRTPRAFAILDVQK